MAYIVFLDDVPLPVAPSKMTTSIQNRNKTVDLINGEEVTVLNKAGLTQVSFTAMIPHVAYAFGYYPEGFKEAAYYLSHMEKLKLNLSPFRFICIRTSPSGELLFETNLKVSLESYQIEESASDGQALMVTINLKQYRDYGTETSVIETTEDEKTIISTSTERSVESSPEIVIYKVIQGDTLWNIAKKYLGDGSKYKEIAKLNNLTNPNDIYVGQVLRISGEG